MEFAPQVREAPKNTTFSLAPALAFLSKSEKLGEEAVHAIVNRIVTIRSFILIVSPERIRAESAIAPRPGRTPTGEQP